VIKKDYEDIPYETTYEEDGTLNNGDEVVATEGNNGIRTITYELIVDSNNKELNRNEVDSTITTPVVNKVIKRNTNSVATDEEVVPVEETDDSQITTNNDAKETKEPTASDTVCGLIGLTILIGGPIFLIRKIFKK
jgi:uncharacterized protein YabE (DUF348 family)